MEGVRGWGPGLPALWGAGGEGEPLSPRAAGTEECDLPSFLCQVVLRKCGPGPSGQLQVDGHRMVSVPEKCPQVQ